MPENRPAFLILLDKLLEKLEGKEKEADTAATVPASANSEQQSHAKKEISE